VGEWSVPVGVLVRFPRGESVTVLVEQRNTTTGVSALVADRTLDGVAWAPVGQQGGTSVPERVVSNRGGVDSGRTLFTPPGSKLRASERVQFSDGSVWEVAVDADEWRSPLTGWSPGDRVPLTRATPPS
jgi:hypothetical protein